jgi:hypothetical protein
MAEPEQEEKSDFLALMRYVRDMEEAGLNKPVPAVIDMSETFTVTLTKQSPQKYSDLVDRINSLEAGFVAEKKIKKRTLQPGGMQPEQKAAPAPKAAQPPPQNPQPSPAAHNEAAAKAELGDLINTISSQTSSPLKGPLFERAPAAQTPQPQPAVSQPQPQKNNEPISTPVKNVPEKEAAAQPAPQLPSEQASKNLPQVPEPEGKGALMVHEAETRNEGLKEQQPAPAAAAPEVNPPPIMQPKAANGSIELMSLPLPEQVNKLDQIVKGLNENSFNSEQLSLLVPELKSMKRMLDSMEDAHVPDEHVRALLEMRRSRVAEAAAILKL